MWLVRHLELIRQITLEDLRVAKTLCQPVFPPSYDIMDYFIKIYNDALTNRLNEIITLGLQDQEFVTMLGWIIQTYPGPELMAHERLQIPPEKVPSLLTADTIDHLESQYLKNMAENYSKWMNNAMKLEVEDWYRERDPDPDSEGAFQTSTPKMIYRDYTTIQRMTIPRLTKWRPDFDILMIQRLFFFFKKKAKIFFLPLTGFT